MPPPTPPPTPSQPTSQPVNQPTNQATSRPPANQPTNQPTIQPASQPSCLSHVFPMPSVKRPPARSLYRCSAYRGATSTKTHFRCRHNAHASGAPRCTPAGFVGSGFGSGGAWVAPDSALPCHSRSFTMVVTFGISRFDPHCSLKQPRCKSAMTMLLVAKGWQVAKGWLPQCLLAKERRQRMHMET